MKTLVSLLVLILVALPAWPQQRITGKVLDNEGQPLTGVNVYIKNSYDGASTDTSGRFSFKTNATGKQLLVASYIGCKTQETELNLSEKVQPLIITLSQAPSELAPVVITAGTFEAGDTKRSVVLKLLDISTTPSAVGDVYGALATFPGTQIVGDKGGLYVRGGEGYETKTFFDGMQVANPYFSNMPDLPERGRFSPILFSGTVFSTGGYSAEYGQALSSALILNTTGVAEKEQTGVSLMSVGASASHTEHWDKASLALSATYSNMSAYNNLFPSNLSWSKSPESFDLTSLYRLKRGKYGLLKVYTGTNINSSALYYNPDLNSSKLSLINLKNSDLYVNTVYTDKLSNTWMIKTGLAFTRDNLTMKQDTFQVGQPVSAAHQRITLTHEPNNHFSLKFGEDVSLYSYYMDYRQLLSNIRYRPGFRIVNPALYAESELRLGLRLAVRAGVRGEYLSLTNEYSVVPRVSFAYKTGENSQVSLAYGMFTQGPEKEYLLFAHHLESERASHYILNYQYEKNNRLFRIEGYRKDYSQLVKYSSLNNPDPLAYNNNGNGYSLGFDLYWRDSHTLRFLDYWVSYSYIDTKRNYKNYSESRTPAFVSPQTFSVVAKYMFTGIKLHAAVNYTHASSKTWFNPDLPGDITAKTKAYNDFSINLVYLTKLFRNSAIVYFNVNNIFGFNNVFGYNYSAEPSHNQSYTLYPVKPASKRFFILGLFLSFN